MEINNSEPQFQEDRISNLPDDILVSILSILNFKKAAQTSILSHRWVSLWKDVPQLHFVTALDETDDRFCNWEKRNRYMPVFAKLVNRVLDLRGTSSYLQEFKIVCELDKCYQNDIDKWLEYALGLGVESLELNLARCLSTHTAAHLYDFPNKLLSQSFSRLRELCFVAVNISGEAIECLLLKCPLLEDLRVLYSEVLVNVVVSGPSLLLKYLEIIDYGSVRSIRISNTNIVSFRVSTCLDKFHLMLDNLPMLTKVWISRIFPEKSIFFSELSCCLPQLTTLTIQTFHPEYILKLYKLPLLENLRRLVLIPHWCAFKSLIGLTSIIESCPNLVEFALVLHPVDGVNKRSYEDQKPANEESVKSLKVFEYYGYHGKYEYEDELMMFFIKKGVALEKIVIDPRQIHVNHGNVPIEDERSKESGRLAVEKYKSLVPKYVEFVVL